MNNKIEILRAICFTKEDMDNITNLADSFTDKEIEFMVEFKKIYELGTTQLKKFIDKLDEEGKDLDTYSIQYYIDVLRNGPLGSYVREYSEFKKYFTNTPDSLGLLGNKNRSTQNTTIFSTDAYPLGCVTDTFNRLPKFMQTTITDSVKQVENVFRSSLKSSSEVDNTLPIIDKSNQLRQNEEPTGRWVLYANANHMVKDSYYNEIIEEISESIFKKIKLELGDEDYRMYKDKKQYTPFSSEQNEMTATNNKIKKNIITGDNESEVTLDLMGDVFDSESSRESVLKIFSIDSDKDVEYKLHTVTGQLGN
jgi:hypothetical protein